MSEPWARVGLTISAPSDKIAEITAMLGRPTESHREDLWAADLQVSSSQPIDEQFLAVREFLASHSQTLQNISEWGQINLQVSWSPRSPQDGLIVDTELIRLLGNAGAFLLLDTYAD